MLECSCSVCGHLCLGFAYVSCVPSPLSTPDDPQPHQLPTRAARPHSAAAPARHVSVHERPQKPSPPFRDLQTPCSTHQHKAAVRHVVTVPTGFCSRLDRSHPAAIAVASQLVPRGAHGLHGLLRARKPPAAAAAFRPACRLGAATRRQTRARARTCAGGDAAVS